LSTKIHLLADTRARPLARVVTAGQRGDTLAFDPLLAQLSIRRRGRGRPRTRPSILLGDKAYSARAIRTQLRRRGIRAVIAEPADQAANRGSAGRPVDAPQRSTGTPTGSATPPNEPCASFKAHRAVAMRTDKREYMYCSTIDVASIRIWLRDLTRHPPNTP
jgi:hypothetical protein